MPASPPATLNEDGIVSRNIQKCSLELCRISQYLCNTQLSHDLTIEEHSLSDIQYFIFIFHVWYCQLKTPYRSLASECCATASEPQS